MREEVAAYLLSKGARLSIFSAIALDRGDDVRAMVGAEKDLLSRRMSRNEHGRLPLHHAVVCDRPAMVELLLALGADANAADLTGAAPIAYARRPAIVQMLIDAGGHLDLIGALTLERHDLAEAMLAQDPTRLGPAGRDTIALLMAVDRRNEAAVRWLIAHGVDVNAKRVLYDCNQTALHVCADRGLVDIAAAAAAGADTTILDDKFHAEALGWAEYCKQVAVAKLNSRPPGGIGWQRVRPHFRKKGHRQITDAPFICLLDYRLGAEPERPHQDAPTCPPITGSPGTMTTPARRGFVVAPSRRVPMPIASTIAIAFCDLSDANRR